MNRSAFKLCGALGLLVAVSIAQAETTVTNAWIRGTVPQQKATGMFGQITSSTGGKLVAASSPAAATVEIHEMAMEGTVMKMREVSGGLDLPAGKPVALSPGGYHVMLLDLKHRLEPGDIVPMTLIVEGKDGRRESVEIQVPVKPLTTSAGDMSGMKH